MNVLDNNWVSLENSRRLRAELLSSKGQCYLHRGRQASNFFSCQTLFSATSRKVTSWAVTTPKVKVSLSVNPEPLKCPTTISHMQQITLYIGCEMHIPLSIHPTLSALSLARISSHLQYL